MKLKAAIGRAKLAKAAEETGLIAALLGYMPDDICNDLLHMFNHMLFPGGARAIWRKNLFKMLPKKKLKASNDNGLQTNCEHAFVL